MTWLTRREMIGLGIAGSFVCLGGGRHMGAQSLTSARDAVDHLLLGCANLQHGIAWVEARTGVRAAIGGSHPGRGTHNALLGLGDRQYLEVIAPDPAQPAGLRPDLAALKDPRLITWASGTRDLGAVVRTGRAAGMTISDPRDGERKRPDGRVLRWRTAAPSEQFAEAGIIPVPFFIEWATDAVHPAGDSPSGCRLEQFRLEHPSAGRLQTFLRGLGIDAPVEQSASAALIARLATPKGTVTLR